MTETIENLFLFISTYIPLLPIVAFLVLLLSDTSKWYERSFFIVIAYSLSEFITNIISVGDITIQEYRLLYSTFTGVEYGLFAWIFFCFIKNKGARKALIMCSIAFYLFWIIYRIYGTYKVLDSIPIGVETIIILIFTFWYFFEQMDNVEEGFIYYKPNFWVVAGVMIYLAGSFFCYILANQVDSKTRNVYWMFTNMFATIKCTFFLVGILIFYSRARRKKRPLFSPTLSSIL
jgi:hypothetical protein